MTSDTYPDAAQPEPLLDPGNAVPDEYDVLCDGCGYSLVGISSNQCPECGKPFEAEQLPFARIPWLHRRKIGTFKAFRATCREVLRRPRQTAQELCRPVRISAADARGFRRMVIRTATLGAALALLQITALLVDELYIKYNQPFARRQISMRYFYIDSGAALCYTVTWLWVIYLFFRLLTDLPVFIWKGHPSMKPTELAPIHNYASAPLVMLLAVPVILLAVLLTDRFHNLNNFEAGLIAVGCGGAAIIWFVRYLRTLFQMMTGAGVSRRRAWWMVAYMPAHLLMMAFVCFGIGVIAQMVETFGFRVLRQGHF